MNKIVLLITFWVVAISSFSFSQAIDLTKKISISANNKSLEEVLTEIEEKEGIHFSLSNEKVNTSEKISLNVKNKSLQFVLDEICRQLNLEYAVVEKQVILKPKKSDKSTTTEKTASSSQNLPLAAMLPINQLMKF